LTGGINISLFTLVFIKTVMRNLLFLLFFSSHVVFAQQALPKPCSTNPVYRQFDFWIGDWEVYGLNDKKAGDSKIERILDSCVILENWKSAGGPYSGKSFNTYNAMTKQWQQIWVDNVGGSTEFLEGKYEDQKMIFRTKPYPVSKDTMAIRRLSFYNLSADKVRQHGEISKDNGANWKTEYDLEYRRKNN
jgi:hypothetical protein